MTAKTKGYLARFLGLLLIIAGVALIILSLSSATGLTLITGIAFGFVLIAAGVVMLFTGTYNALAWIMDALSSGI